MLESQRWIPISTLAVLLVVAAGCAKTPLDRAQAFIDAGMATDAIPLLQLEIQSEPKNARAHLMLGEAQLFLNDRDAAEQSFGCALMLNPGWGDRVGKCYVNAASRMLAASDSRPERAVQYLMTARSKTRGLDKPIAAALVRAAIQDNSTEWIKNAVEMYPGLSRSDTIAAMLANDGSLTTEARIAALEKFVAQYPKSLLLGYVLLNLANYEVTVGHRDKAKGYAERAERLASQEAVVSSAREILQQIQQVEATEDASADVARNASLMAREAMRRQKLDQEANAAQMAAAEKEQADRSLVLESARRERESRIQAARAAELAREKARLVGRLHASDAAAEIEFDSMGGAPSSPEYVAVRGLNHVLQLGPASTDVPGFAELECYVPATGAKLVADYCLSRQDCGGSSDYIARLVVVDANDRKHVIHSGLVNDASGWVRMRPDLSGYADQVVKVRFEVVAGGSENWWSEWAGLARFYVVR